MSHRLSSDRLRPVDEHLFELHSVFRQSALALLVSAAIWSFFVDDMLGLFTAFKAKFVKRYAHLGDDAKAAVQAYADEVTARSFPGPEHVFSDEVSKT